MTSATTPLDGERYINLETFRKDGSGVKTPVWAAAQDGKLVVTTGGTSFKAKRLRHDPRFRAAACDSRGNVRGPWFAGTARFLEDPAASARAEATLKGKYGLQWTVFGFFSRLSGRAKDRVFLELTIDGPATP
jgi:PPOX class probable F420-dependent enzyme